MRVFILCTGRSGSVTFIKACEKIENYSCGHETLGNNIGSDRMIYQDNHIEADNRLSWFLGALDHDFGNNAMYVHLKRDKENTVRSLNRRWRRRGSIVPAFCEGILMIPPEKLGAVKRMDVCSHLYDTMNTNIVHFLENKTNTLTINLENIKNDFKEFWNFIEADGDLNEALKVFDTNYNYSKKPLKDSLRYSVNKIIDKYENKINQFGYSLIDF